MLNFLNLISNIFGILFIILYWKSISIFGYRVPFYIFSIFFFSFCIFINIRHLKSYLRIIIRYEILVIFLFVLLFIISGLFTRHPEGLVFIPKTTVSLILAATAAMSFYALSVSQRDGISKAASYAFLLFCINLIFTSGGVSLFNVYSEFLGGDVRAASLTWRKIFAGYDFDPRIHQESNFRNGVAAVFGVLAMMIASGQSTARRNAVLLLLLFTLATLFSQSGLLYLFLFLLFYVFGFRIHVVKILIFGFAALVLCLTLVATLDFETVLSGQYFMRFENSIAARKNLYESAFQAILASPIFGNGLGYKLQFNDLEVSAHNHFLTLWMQVGIVGMLMFASLYLYLLSGLMKYITGRASKKRYLSNFTLCASLALIPALVRPMVGSSIEGLFSVGEIMGIAFFATAGILLQQQKSYNQRTEIKRSHSL